MCSCVPLERVQLVRLYDCESKKVKKSYRHDVPVLDCKFEHRGGTATAMLSGGLDGKVIEGDQTMLGDEEKSVVGVFFFFLGGGGGGGGGWGEEGRYEACLSEI